MKKNREPENRTRQIKAGRCLIIFLAIIVLLSLGAIWVVTEVSILHKEKMAEKRAGERRQKTADHDWKTIADNLIAEYKGKILYIEKLNSKTCRAVLSPGLSDLEAVELAENIGHYIRNSTVGINMATPLVNVFINGKHVAVARPSGVDYIGEISP